MKDWRQLKFLQPRRRSAVRNALTSLSEEILLRRGYSQGCCSIVTFRASAGAPKTASHFQPSVLRSMIAFHKNGLCQLLSACCVIVGTCPFPSGFAPIAKAGRLGHHICSAAGSFSSRRGVVPSAKARTTYTYVSMEIYRDPGGPFQLLVVRWS